MPFFRETLGYPPELRNIEICPAVAHRPEPTFLPALLLPGDSITKKIRRRLDKKCNNDFIIYSVFFLVEEK